MEFFGGGALENFHHWLRREVVYVPRTSSASSDRELNIAVLMLKRWVGYEDRVDWCVLEVPQKIPKLQFLT